MAEGDGQGDDRICTTDNSNDGTRNQDRTPITRSEGTVGEYYRETRHRKQMIIGRSSIKSQIKALHLHAAVSLDIRAADIHAFTRREPLRVIKSRTGIREGNMKFLPHV